WNNDLLKPRASKSMSPARSTILAAFIVGTAALHGSQAFACGGIFDVACNLQNGGLSPDNLRRQAEEVARQAERTARDAGNIFAPYLDPRRQLPMAVAQACIQNLSQCPQQIVSRAGYEVARPIVDQYISALRAQASGRYNLVP